MSKTVEETYQRKTETGHVLSRSAMYLGSNVASELSTYVLQDCKFTSKTITYIQLLAQLVKEAVTNAIDHADRTKLSENPVKTIDISIADDGAITIFNDGEGIPIVEHSVERMYVPQLIFFTLRTSGNYDDAEKKTVAGQNGYGIKLVFIWSSEASIDLCDGAKRYRQSVRNNMSIIDPPTITAYKKKSYTRVTFKPDYQRLGIETLSQDHRELFQRYCYDVAAVTDKRVKVTFNNLPVPVKDFLSYVKLFPDTEKLVSETTDRWEVAASVSEDAVVRSFVNGLETLKNGKHVDYIIGQIARKMVAHVKEKKKVDVPQSFVRNHLSLYLSCRIDNPSFDSQTKDCLTTPSSNFGSTFEVSDAFVEKLAKQGMLDLVVTLTRSKEDAQLKKDHDGSKTRTIRGIPKLCDAEFAGTAKSKLCTLILCEGDSAKAGVISGLSQQDRKIYGVYPLKGKPLNVRGETLARVAANKEVHELVQILGLEFGKKYTPDDVGSKLRYSKVCVLSDADDDGIHIKGLILNLFESLWPTLSQLDGFIAYLTTPIIKARRGKSEVSFYHHQAYEEWNAHDRNGWTIKYYKGLGTSTAAEFKEYMRDADKKLIAYKNDDSGALSMMFDKGRANDRKEWMVQHDPSLTLDPLARVVTYADFANREMVHFSIADNLRSIPNLMDGFKPSQRKVFYGCVRRTKGEVKVAQLSGYVSEHAAYHHGEASLNGTIVGMAQDFVGSNNINLLEPKGQFGTRLQGGKDCASARYIFTNLSELASKIFKKEDDGVIGQLEDDGMLVEPAFYAPIIPMILVNGANGIGTGTSTQIPCYDPKQLVRWVSAKLGGEAWEETFVPYYRGFKGTVELDGAKALVRGVFKLDGLNLKITELPVGTWTDDYKEFLEGLIGTTVKEYTDHSTDTVVDISVKLLAEVVDVEKTFKLCVSKSLSNMNLFGADGKLKKYDVDGILQEYYDVRLDLYGKRKAAMLGVMTADLKVLVSKVAYVRGVVSGLYDLRGKNKTQVDEMLSELPKMEESYNYLTKMAMDSVTEEKAAKLQAEHDALATQVSELERMTPEEMWAEDLKKIYL
jgi:DNA topoisomerase II